MTDDGIFAKVANVVRKVGENGSATQVLEATINDFSAQAESHINVESEYNWSDVFTTLNVDVKGILKEAASNLAAIYCISLNPNSWSTSTATFKVNVLWSGYMECIRLLREKDKAQIFIKEA